MFEDGSGFSSDFSSGSGSFALPEVLFRFLEGGGVAATICSELEFSEDSFSVSSDFDSDGGKEDLALAFEGRVLLIIVLGECCWEDVSSSVESSSVDEEKERGNGGGWGV